MENYILDTSAGNSIERVAKDAKELAVKNKFTVEFMFNGVKCLVNENTVVDWLIRDYMNAHIMEWKTVGADCKMEYDHDTEIELHTRKLRQAKERKKRDAEYRAKEAKAKREVDKKVSKIEMEFSDKAAWDLGKSKNTDPYGGACYDFAEAWAKLMQAQINQGVKVKDCADKTSYEADTMGISGFMYSAAVSILSQTWKYGDELRKWHNKEYDYEVEGTVNPAILTIKG